jgi:hypothetical protein
MVVEMEKPLVIETAEKPRCFKNLKINNLPVNWRNNKKAWMTVAIMEEWLNMFKAKMKQENRSVILFPDNATCHPKVTLSNVKIAWFPANATSALQPMDMGVIYIFKSHYNRFLMQSFSDVEEADSSYALARSVSVLDAVNWIGLAVKKIEAETVKKSFAKAGCGENDVADNWRRQMETLAQYLISAEEKKFSAIQRTLFGVMTLQLYYQ